MHCLISNWLMIKQKLKQPNSERSTIPFLLVLSKTRACTGVRATLKIFSLKRPGRPRAGFFRAITPPYWKLPRRPRDEVPRCVSNDESSGENRHMLLFDANFYHKSILWKPWYPQQFFQSIHWRDNFSKIFLISTCNPSCEFVVCLLVGIRFIDLVFLQNH